MMGFRSKFATRLILAVFLIFVVTIGGTNQASAFLAPLFNALLKGVARSSDDALRHGDEVIKRAMPKPDDAPSPTPRPDEPSISPEAALPSGNSSTNTARSSELNAGLAIGRTAPRYFRHCRQQRTYPRKAEILEISGQNVRARACGSTKCSIIGNFRTKGNYKLDVIDRKQCWIKFHFQNQEGKFVGFVYEKFARVR
jgi:hypothetical protein